MTSGTSAGGGGLHDCLSYPSGQERGNGVSELGLHRGTLADKGEIIWKRKEAAEFRNSQAAILPVEWPNIWPRLGLDGRRGAARVQFEQE